MTSTTQTTLCCGQQLCCASSASSGPGRLQFLLIQAITRVLTSGLQMYLLTLMTTLNCWEFASKCQRQIHSSWSGYISKTETEGASSCVILHEALRPFTRPSFKFTDGRPLSRAHFVTKVRETPTRARINYIPYSGHSFSSQTWNIRCLGDGKAVCINCTLRLLESSWL